MKMSNTRLEGKIDDLINVLNKQVRGAPSSGPSNSPLGSQGSLLPIPAPLVTAFNTVTSAVGRTAAGFNAFKRPIEENLNIWRNLTKSGIAFDNSVVDMAVSAHHARMSVDGFADLLGTNSIVLASLGAGIGDGAKQFSKLSKSFFEANQEGAIDKLQFLGYTASDLNEVLALQVGIARTSISTNAEGSRRQIDAAVKLATEMDALARLTGKTRKEQAEMMQKRQMDMAIEAKLRLAAADTGVDYTELRAEFFEKQRKADVLGIGQLYKEQFLYNAPSTTEAQSQYVTAGPAAISLAESARKIAEGDFGGSKESFSKVEEQLLTAQNSRTNLMLASLDTLTGDIGTAARSLMTDMQPMHDATIRIRQETENLGITLADAVAVLKERIDKAQIGIPTDATGKEGIKTSQATEAAIMIEARYADIVASTATAFKLSSDKLAGGIGEVADSMLSAKVQIDQAAATMLGMSDRIGTSGTAFISFSELLEARLTTGFEDGAKTLPPAEAMERVLAEKGITGSGIAEVGSTIAGLTGVVGDFATDMANWFFEMLDFKEVTADAVAEGAEKGVIAGMAAATAPPTTTPLITPAVPAEPVSSPRPGLSTGTIGKMGTLFGEFGSGTDVILHDKEAVLTPEQLMRIVKGTHETGAASAFSSLAAMLNDVSSPSAAPSANVVMNINQNNTDTALPSDPPAEYIIQIASASTALTGALKLTASSARVASDQMSAVTVDPLKDSINAASAGLYSLATDVNQMPAEYIIQIASASTTLTGALKLTASSARVASDQMSAVTVDPLKDSINAASAGLYSLATDVNQLPADTKVDAPVTNMPAFPKIQYDTIVEEIVAATEQLTSANNKVTYSISSAADRIGNITFDPIGQAADKVSTAVDSVHSAAIKFSSSIGNVNNIAKPGTPPTTKVDSGNLAMSATGMPGHVARPKQPDQPAKQPTPIPSAPKPAEQPTSKDQTNSELLAEIKRLNASMSKIAETNSLLSDILRATKTNNKDLFA
jgi:hypothetical protein